MKQAKMTAAQIKVFVPYGSVGYVNWIPNHILVKDMKEADLVFLTGGEDCDPALYNEKPGRYTHFNPNREAVESAAIKQAISLGKPMFGTCKGLQMLCVMAGGKLIQDLDHPGSHTMVTKEGNVFSINSLHHQAINPYNLPADEYEILATTEELLSETHTNGDNEEIEGVQEIEAAFFPKIKALGVQYHPEMMSYYGTQTPHFDWLREQVETKLGLKVEKGQAKEKAKQYF